MLGRACRNTPAVRVCTARLAALFSHVYNANVCVWYQPITRCSLFQYLRVLHSFFTFVNEKVLLIQSALFTSSTLFTLHLVLSKSTACAVRLKELIGHRIRTVDGSVPLRPSVSLIAMLVLV